jgi:hypothetical protein
LVGPFSKLSDPKSFASSAIWLVRFATALAAGMRYARLLVERYGSPLWERSMEDMTWTTRQSFAEAIVRRQIEGAIALVSVLAIFAAVVIIFSV